MPKRYWCSSILLPEGWGENVTLTVTDDGWIDDISSESDSNDCERITGHLMPGMANLHSHAHQRAMAGMGEHAGEGRDSFWSWRKVMYHYLERIRPDHLYHISRQLYLEMLRSGYTSVAEFQYLHHDIDGRPYANRAEMTLQCRQAALDTGIGFTALPVLYLYGGFGGQGPHAQQRRFLNNADEFSNIIEQLNDVSQLNPDCAVGIAPHSLRAVTPELLTNVLETSLKDIKVIHIHIAEQIKEVEDCLLWSNQRPVEWLFNHFEINGKWCLIHATHMCGREARKLAASSAIAGLCPSTEANLGDGFFAISDYHSDGGRWGIGSDSQISVSPVEELRWLEYGSRLTTGLRNVITDSGTPNTGKVLLDAALAGGAQACGRATGKIAAGYRADFVVLDHEHPRLYGRHGNDVVDSWIFSGNENPVRDVFVGGRKVINQGHHTHAREIERNFQRTIDQLSL